MAHTLRARLSKLGSDNPQADHLLESRVPDPEHWNLVQLCESFDSDPGTQPGTPAAYFFELNALLINCIDAAFNVSDDISATYFTHSGEKKQSLGV